MDDINVNMIADQLAKKVDLPDNKGQDGIDYVVEWKNPTESDPTWYRVYKSGWVEQGGEVTTTSNGAIQINLTKRMLNNKYSLCGACSIPDSAHPNNPESFASYNKTETSFYAGVHDDDSWNKGTFTWEAKGQGEI